MAVESLLGGKVELHCGDCLDVLPALAENSVDSCVTDPPYHLTSIVKRFGANGAAPAQFGKDGRFKRLSGGFMSKAWDAPDIPAIDPGFAYWLAGFIDGEGCFSVHKKRVNDCETYDCQFSMTLREDDKDVVAEIQRQLGGIGSIAFRPAPKEGGGKPQIRYCISSQRDCWRLREVLQVFPLRAKKARDFDIWSHALDAWIAHEPGQSWEDVAYFRDALMAVRRYGADFHPSQLWAYRWAREVYRVLKPGAHLLAFGGTRTYHRLAAAIEDAGFEIRDTIMWVYGSGFPKSHDVSKGIDKAAGIKRGTNPDFRNGPNTNNGTKGDKYSLGYGGQSELDDGPATPAARQWQGWGTALKPACEPIVVARKPLSEGNVAANVLRWGTGVINVDGCRIEAEPWTRPNGAAGAGFKTGKFCGYAGAGEPTQTDGVRSSSLGRWPANLIHDGSEEVVAGFPEVDGQIGMVRNVGASLYSPDYPQSFTNGEKDSAARFFYTSKADSDDRLGSKHPTVKPLDLMQYLIRLVTPKGGLVLDPFAGTGTTGEAAFREGMRAVLIEREAEYQADIRRRMALALSGPDERARQAIKERMKDKPTDDGPLFDWISPDASPPQPIA